MAKLSYGIFLLIIILVVGGMCGTTPMDHHYLVYVAAALCLALVLFTSYRAASAEEDEHEWWKFLQTHSLYGLSVTLGVCGMSLLLQKYGQANENGQELLASGLFGASGSVLLVRTLMADQLVVAKKK